jgi:ribosomal protein S18 acetylase RimI-like enzyme
MKFTTLQDVPQSVLTDCFNEGFSDYALNMTATDQYLSDRWKLGGVDFSLSGGAWIDKKLVGIVIIMLGEVNGILTAFNGATCVRPEARGQAATQRIFDFLIPKFQAKGVKKAQLEVLEKNDRAIAVYKKIGFSIDRKLLCFKEKEEASLVSKSNKKAIIEACPSVNPTDFLDWKTNKPGWEQSDSTIINFPEKHQFFVVKIDSKIIAYIIVCPGSKLISQILISPENRIEDIQNVVFSYLRQQNLPTRQINIGENSKELINFLLASKFTNFVNQFEMSMILD